MKTLITEDLETLGISTQRFIMDKVVNSNGHKLIDFCKELNLHIVIGRFGNDSKIGKFTYGDTSTVDYVIVSPELFYQIDDFNVDVFDSFMSDKHKPIWVKFAFSNVSGNSKKISSYKLSDNDAINKTEKLELRKVTWQNEKRFDFIDSFNEDIMYDLLKVLDGIDVCEMILMAQLLVLKICLWRQLKKLE